MKSRWTTYVLLVVVLAVWGAVAWKIFNPSSKDEANTVPQVRVQVVPKEHQDTLLCDYPDPFLKGGGGKFRRAGRPCVSSPKSRLSVGNVLSVPIWVRWLPGSVFFTS